MMVSILNNFIKVNSKIEGCFTTSQDFENYENKLQSHNHMLIK